jgi:hypothetical protein
MGFSFLFKVSLNFPSGIQKKKVRDKMAHIIKSFVVGSHKSALQQIIQHPKQGDNLQELVVDIMDTKCQNICKVNSNSILRGTPLDFDMGNFNDELKAKAPITTRALKTLCTSKRTRNKCSLKQDIVTSTVAAVILHSRCPEMSAFAYRLGFICRHSGAGTMVCCCFCWCDF